VFHGATSPAVNNSRRGLQLQYSLPVSSSQLSAASLSLGLAVVDNRFRTPLSTRYCVEHIAVS